MSTEYDNVIEITTYSDDTDDFEPRGVFANLKDIDGRVEFSHRRVDSNDHLPIYEASSSDVTEQEISINTSDEISDAVSTALVDERRFGFIEMASSASER